MKRKNCRETTIVASNNMFFYIASFLAHFGSPLISLIFHYVSVYACFSSFFQLTLLSSLLHSSFSCRVFYMICGKKVLMKLHPSAAPGCVPLTGSSACNSDTTTKITLTTNNYSRFLCNY